MIGGLTYAGNSRYCYSNSESAYIGEYGSEKTYSIGSENIALWSALTVYDGKYYTTQGTDIVITDISLALSGDLSNDVHIISAEYIAAKPNVSGITVSDEIIDYDSFALTVLSQDSSYDICLANSRQTFSATLRDKGSFYPLNDIDGVNEYLEQCFPYLREAATDADGNVWMLPIAVSIPSLAVNPSVCEKFGAEDILTMNGEESINLVIEMGKDSEKCKYIGSVNLNYYTELMVSAYLMDNDTLDTPKFRSMLQKIKETMFANYDIFYNKSEGLLQAHLSGDYSELPFSTVSHDYDYRMLNAGGATLRPVPTLADSTSSVATITYITVNPSAGSLAAACDYVSRLAKQLMADQNSMTLENSPLFSSDEFYSELKKICGDAKARFSMDNEIFINDIYNYLEGTSSLDEAITEADRKLRAYLNE